jgi:hypothetical protein
VEVDRRVNGIGGITLLNRPILVGSPPTGQRARPRLRPAPSGHPLVTKTATADRGLPQPVTAEQPTGAVYFSGATFSGYAVYFNGAMFSGGGVSFSGAEFSGGTVDFHDRRGWSYPPAFGQAFDGPGPPPGITPRPVHGPVAQPGRALQLNSRGNW